MRLRRKEVIYSKKTIEKIRQNFESLSKETGWEELSEQILCNFLLQNSSLLLGSGGKAFLKELLASFSSAPPFIHKFLDSGSSLIVGDESGLLCADFPKADFLFYTEESLKRSSATGSKALLMEGLGSAKYPKIVVLDLMEHLKKSGLVQELNRILRTLIASLKGKGCLLVCDRLIYQDDFVCHLVESGAEIKDLQKSGKNDFILVSCP